MKDAKRKVEEIRQIIKEYRQKKVYSQENMATILGITQNSYHKLETGVTKMSLERLFIINSSLDISIINLMNDEEKEKLLYMALDRLSNK